MSVVQSLPTEPLSEDVILALNDADALEIALPVGKDEERARGVMLATQAWLKALAFDGEAWQVVETYDLADMARVDAIQDGEEAIESFLDE